jgi:hypothetical protein
MIEIFRRDHGLRQPNDILLGWPNLLPYGLTHDFHEFAAILYAEGVGSGKRVLHCLI